MLVRLAMQLLQSDLLPYPQRLEKVIKAGDLIPDPIDWYNPKQIGNRRCDIPTEWKSLLCKVNQAMCVSKKVSILLRCVNLKKSFSYKSTHLYCKHTLTLIWYMSIIFRWNSNFGNKPAKEGGHRTLIFLFRYGSACFDYYKKAMHQSN